MLNVLKCLLKTITGNKHMKNLYLDIVDKNTKSFVFKVDQLDDGSFEVIQQALRKFPDGSTQVRSEKVWKFKSLSEMRDGEFKTSRQGKLFLDDQFWIGKLA